MRTAYAKELEPFRTSMGTLRFTPDAPIPKRPVERIVKARLLEIDAVSKQT